MGTPTVTFISDVSSCYHAQGLKINEEIYYGLWIIL